MRILKIAALAAVMVFPVSSVLAAIEGTSNLTISDFVVNEVGGDGILLNSISGGMVFESSETEAALDGFVPVVNSVGSVDAPVASVGAPVGENAFPAHGSVGGLPFAYSDSDGSGSIVISPGASSRTQSGIGVSAGAPIAGMTSATSSLTVFSFSTLEDITVNFTFEGLLDMTLENMASAPPLSVDTAGSFVVTITGTAPGFVASYTSTADPLVDDLSLVTESLSTSGIIDGPQVDDSFTSSPIFLAGDGAYTLTLSQTTSASLAVIPEPTSSLVWGLLFVASGSAVRRRRG